MSFPCPTTTSTDCVDTVESSLLSMRFGYGFATTGGFGLERCVVTQAELDNGTFIQWLEQGNKYVLLDSSLAGVTFNYSGVTQIGPNLTLDGYQAQGFTIQYGTPDDFINNPNAQKSKFDLSPDGNIIIHCVRLVGDFGTANWSSATDNAIAQNQNGPTQGLLIYDGSNFWIDHVTFESFSDEAIAIYHFPDNVGTPTNITLSNNVFVNNKHNVIVGSNDPDTQQKALVTAAFNDYGATYGDRSPGLVGSAQFHEFNNYIHDQAIRTGGSALSAFENAFVYSEYSVYDSSTANFGEFGPGCAIYQTNNFFPNGPNPNDDDCQSTPEFTIPTDAGYANYQKLTTQAAVLDYVSANAGSENCDRQAVVCASD